MADFENETLEETQRRLASQASSAASPWVNPPATATVITSSVGASTPPVPPPYRGPATAAAPDPEPAFARPALDQPASVSAAPPVLAGGGRGARRGILIAAIIAAVLAVVGITITIALVSTVVRPPVDAIWIDYPGNAYSEPAEVLASDSKEVVVADAEAFLEAYRAELTAELGLEWSETWEGSLEYGSNYYDGESLLWDYNSGEWQGSVRLDDPTARARVAEVFERVSAQFGASDYRLNNAIYLDDAAQSEEQFGAAQLDDQAVWSFTSSGDDARQQFRIAGRAWDRSIDTAPTFTGDVWFNEEAAGSDTFVVVVSLWSYDLLAETDRAEYLERLEPYEGLERPEPN